MVSKESKMKIYLYKPFHSFELLMGLNINSFYEELNINCLISRHLQTFFISIILHHYFSTKHHLFFLCKSHLNQFCYLTFSLIISRLYYSPNSAILDRLEMVCVSKYNFTWFQGLFYSRMYQAKKPNKIFNCSYCLDVKLFFFRCFISIYIRKHHYVDISESYLNLSSQV